MITFLTLLATALFGQYTHWLKKRVRKQTLSSYFNYLKGHKTHTKNAFIGIFVAIVTLYQVSEPEISTQWLSQMFLLGFGIDSTLNKSPED